MCGENAVEKIESNLRKYAPRILECAGFSVPDPSQLSEKDMIHVLEGIEMCVRPSNAGSTGPSLISIYEV